MADRAEHPVLFVEHCGDAARQAVEGGDHVAHVARPLDRDGRQILAWREAAGGTGEAAQRARDAARDPQNGQQDQDVDDRGLCEERPQDAVVAPWPVRRGGQPGAVLKLHRDHQHVARSAAEITVAPARSFFPRAQARIDLAGRDPEFGKLIAQLSRDLRHPFQIAGDRIGHAPAHPRTLAAREVLAIAIERVGDADRRGAGRLGKAKGGAFAQDQREVDRLCREQRQGKQQRELPRQAARQQPAHSRVTSAASV